MAPAGNAKSRPGITPCGLIRDCWFPSSVAVMISGGERKGSGLLRKYSVRDIQAEATTNHLVNGVARGSRPSHHYGMEALNGPSGHGAWIVIGSAQPIYALKGKTNSKFGATVMALRVIDSLVLRSEPLILLLGRVCIGSLYLMSGINHWLDLTLLTHFMAGLPGSANLWAMLAATIEVTGGIALVVGFRTRDFALLLVLFNICAAAIGHPYWSITGDATARWAQFIHFWKDIGLVGGTLFVLARGAGPLSFDRG
jgi:putative oxidoreductase